MVDEIYSTLTLRSLESIASHGQPHGGLALALPRASVNQMAGLLETLAAPPYAGHAELFGYDARSRRFKSGAA
ncbi:MAG: hypothetical protein WA807_11005 [Steroidobacteraceae bacterium]